MNSRTPSHILFILSYLLAGFLFAQEPEPEVDEAEVDLILAELEESPDMEEASMEEASMEEVSEATSMEMEEAVSADEDEMDMNEMDMDGPQEMDDSIAAEGEAPAADASAVPAISLEEATEVEGLDIEAGGEDITEGLISVNYEDVPLADIVKIFAQTSGANIIIPQGLTEPVSGNLNDVFWRDALDVILADKGYVLVERTSGIFTINDLDSMAAEPLNTDTLELKYITAETALPALQSMVVSSNASVVPIPQTNVLIVSETAQQLQKIKRLVDIVDQPRKQVFIEAKFVELNDSAIKDLGINWSVLQNYGIRATGMETTYERTTNRVDQDAQVFSQDRSRSSLDTNNRSSNEGGRPSQTTQIGEFNQRNRVTANGSSQFDGQIQGRNFTEFDAEEGTITSVPRMEQEVVRSAILSADDFALTMSALQQLDGVRIVSNPKVLVANGTTAMIHVGENQPNITATFVPNEGGGGNYVYGLDDANPYIEIGVKLDVTPVINTDKNITVTIEPELSRLLREKQAGDAGLTFPVTSIRNILTEFAVSSGNTVAIGGLTQSEEAETIDKVPLLGDLPIIGKYLFSHTSTRMIQDEIIIFVTVKSAHTEKLNDRDGIPDEGKLIQTWLDYQDLEDEAPLRTLN